MCRKAVPGRDVRLSGEKNVLLERMNLNSEKVGRSARRRTGYVAWTRLPRSNLGEQAHREGEGKNPRRSGDFGICRRNSTIKTIRHRGKNQRKGSLKGSPRKSVRSKRATRNARETCKKDSKNVNAPVVSKNNIGKP